MSYNSNEKSEVGAAIYSDQGDESKFIDKRRSNVKSDLIEITSDKLENILLKHLQYLGTRKSWVTPLSIFVTIILANSSATFGDKFGIEGSVWEALFLLIAIVSGIWLLVTTILIMRSWKKSSLSNLLEIIKNADDEKGEKAEKIISTEKELLEKEKALQEFHSIKVIKILSMRYSLERSVIETIFRKATSIENLINRIETATDGAIVTSEVVEKWRKEPHRVDEANLARSLLKKPPLKFENRNPKTEQE